MKKTAFIFAIAAAFAFCVSACCNNNAANEESVCDCPCHQGPKGCPDKPMCANADQQQACNLEAKCDAKPECCKEGAECCKEGAECCKPMPKCDAKPECCQEGAECCKEGAECCKPMPKCDSTRKARCQEARAGKFCKDGKPCCDKAGMPLCMKDGKGCNDEKKCDKEAAK